MAILLIENGCINSLDAANTWFYDYEDNAGSHRITFTSSQRPKVGDSINLDTFSLVPLVGYRINNDPGMQKKDCDEQEWPSRIRAQ